VTVRGHGAAPWTVMSHLVTASDTYRDTVVTLGVTQVIGTVADLWAAVTNG